MSAGTEPPQRRAGGIAGAASATPAAPVTDATSAASSASAAPVPDATSAESAASMAHTRGARGPVKAVNPANAAHLGKRNLILLGVIASLIAMITTGIELVIYRSSGDIYLDRSRPGFLPDAAEAEEDAADNTSYAYPDAGPLNAEELRQYLTELKSLQEHIEKISDPYAAASLSDESLGLTPAPEGGVTSADEFAAD